MVTETERIAILLELKNEAFERKAKSSAKAIDRLEARYDPLAKAARRYEIEQNQLNRALERGTIDADKHAKVMDRVQAEYDQTIAKIKGTKDAMLVMNSAVVAQSGFLQRNRNVFQQAGYQVGDFAVQVQGGTSAITAFTQQGSQLLGVFGPWGAVMGAVLAVGAPLAAVMFGLGKATEKTKEKAKTFTDRVSEADAALSAMAASADAASVGGLESLRKKYGELTEEVKEMALALFEIDKREALGKVSAIITEVTGEIAKASEASAGVVASALASANTESAKEAAAEYRAEIEKMQAAIDQRKAAGMMIDPGEIRQLQEMREELAAMEGDFANIGSLAEQINISPDLLRQISEAQAGLEAARDAGDFSAMATQLGVIRDLLVESGDTVSQDVVDGVTQAEALARDMAARLDEGKDAAEGIANADMSGNIGAAVTEAEKLARWLGISLSHALALSATTPAMADEDAVMSQDVIPDAKQRENNRQAVENYIRLTTPKKSRAGGGRKSKGRKGGREQEPLFHIAEEELEKLQRSIDMIGKSKAEVAALTVKHKLLDEAKKRGLTITDELITKIDAEAASVGELAEKYENARDKVAAMEQIQQSFEDSVVNAAMNGADAMDAFANSIKKAALEYLLFGKGPLSDMGGGFGGLSNLIFGGLTGKRANGGTARAGSAYLVNENTPNSEVFVPSQSGGVLNVPQAQAALRGAGGGGVLRVIIEEGAMFASRVRTEAQGVAVEVTRAGISENNRTQSDARYLRGGS